MYDDVQLGWLAGDDYERVESPRGQHEPAEVDEGEPTDDEAYPNAQAAQAGPCPRATEIPDDLYRRRRADDDPPTAPRPRWQR